jgi:hypothetical protein
MIRETGDRLALEFGILTKNFQGVPAGGAVT